MQAIITKGKLEGLIEQEVVLYQIEVKYRDAYLNNQKLAEVQRQARNNPINSFELRDKANQKLKPILKKLTESENKLHKVIEERSIVIEDINKTIKHNKKPFWAKLFN